VLGLMGEIENSGPAHREIAEYAIELGLDVVIVATDSHGVEPVDDVRAVLGPLGPESVVLVKASRSAGLERVVAELLAR